MKTLFAEVRYGWRMLMKQPAFTAVAVLTLALGLSANTTIFSVLSAFFFRPLPVKNPDQLMLILQKSDLWKLPHGHSHPDYRDYKERLTSFSDLMAYMMTPVHLSVPGQPAERTWIELVSGNYFSLLGVQALHGRLLQPEEGLKPGADPYIVLSHGYWTRRFGADPAVVGKVVNLNGHPFTVLGVTPAEFPSAEWAIAVNAFVPLTMVDKVMGPAANMLENRGAPAFKIMGRLKPEVTLAQARAEVKAVGAQLAKDFPDAHKGASVMVVPEQHARPESTMSEMMPFIGAVFMMMVGLVLFIACANVANLMFSRALARQKEMGIRIALGASRWQVIRQLLIESVLLALLAAGVGLVIAEITGPLLSRFTPSGDIPVRTDTSWDWRAFAFTLVMAVVAGLVTGLAPALRATKGDVHTTLKEGGSTLLASGRHPFRTGLVVSQVAICIIVLICGGLFVQSLLQVSKLDFGLRPANLLMASVDLGMQGYDTPRQRNFQRELLEKVRALPGVEAATLTSWVPFDYGVALYDAAPEGRAGDAKDDYTAVSYAAVDVDYLKTAGVTLLKGREFDGQDNATAKKVAVINTVMAERFWPGQEPVGKRLRFGVGGEYLEVVGVAHTGKYIMLSEEPRPFLYIPLTQHDRAPLTIQIRAAGQPNALIPGLRKVIEGLDPHLPVYNVRTMDEHLRSSVFALMPLRMGATVAAVQGVLGLVLAVMGLYGLVAYVVGQRTREIGVRMALGAQRLDIFRLVVREGLRLTLVGVAVGAVIALGLTQALARLLYGLKVTNVAVYLAMVLLLVGVSVLACYLPARRAAKIDPMRALRCE